VAAAGLLDSRLKTLVDWALKYGERLDQERRGPEAVFRRLEAGKHALEGADLQAAGGAEDDD
jgi:hypothetical protein